MYAVKFRIPEVAIVGWRDIFWKLSSSAVFVDLITMVGLSAWPRSYHVTIKEQNVVELLFSMKDISYCWFMLRLTSTHAESKRPFVDPICNSGVPTLLAMLKLVYGLFFVKDQPFTKFGSIADSPKVGATGCQGGWGLMGKEGREGSCS